MCDPEASILTALEASCDAYLLQPDMDIVDYMLDRAIVAIGEKD